MTAWEYMMMKYKELGWVFFKPSEIYDFLGDAEGKRQLNELAKEGRIRKRETGRIVLIELCDEGIGE
jgi:hypothetical protein